MSKQIATRLKKHGKTLGGWAKSTKRKRTFTLQRANCFLVGVLFDQQVNAEQAWDAAEWITESIGEQGDDFWKAICEIDDARLIGFMQYGWAGSAFHRYPKKMAGFLKGCGKVIAEEYGGDPRKIGRGKKNISKVRERLEKLPGIGPALSRMAVLILARNYGLLGGSDALAQLDVKPDEQLKRVFRRTGLVTGKPSFDDYIKAARKLAPKFPAELDAPAWDIGREFCFPKEPLCNSCPLDECCPKIGVAV